MNVEFLGGAREVGRSAILVNGSLLLDYGTKPGTPPRYPVGDVDPDAVVVSHGHLDHAGAVPALLAGDDRPPVHWTPPTRELALALARDTLTLLGGSYDCPFTENDVKRVTEVSRTHGYREPFEAAGHEVTFYDAGHTPGSAHVLVDEAGRSPASSRMQSGDDGDTRLLYTGDFHTGDVGAPDSGPADADSGPAAERDVPDGGQRLVAPSTARPDADVVVCESTYAHVEHDDRAVVEERFVESVESTLWRGGTAVVPAFAIGRTQEMLLVCAAHDVPCYVDGMGKRITRTLQRYPGFVRDADALGRATAHARFVTGRDGQRRRIADQSTAIVTTSGMLSGGPAMTYVPAVREHPTNLIALTGYQVEGTPGRDLLETGSAEIDGRVLPVSARVEQHDFSAHSDRRGLRSFLDSYRGATVLVNHGDRCEAFAADLRDDGFDAVAPDCGERWSR